MKSLLLTHLMLVISWDLSAHDLTITDVCDPSNINGGTIVYDGIFDPTGINIIVNEYLPSSPSVTDPSSFEYIWLSSLVNEPNTPGNPHWKVVADSENLLDLEVGDLNQTTWFIRCARITGCEDYWGETPRVKVPVDQCKPNGINGGEVAFDGHYQPNDDNVVYNVQEAYSNYTDPDITLEYIWMFSHVDTENVVGNPHWKVVPDSENMLDLEVGDLNQTTWFIRCARITGCEDYWGETPRVKVPVDLCKPNGINGGEVGFDGYYQPNDDNVVYNVQEAYSNYTDPDLTLEYIWMFSHVDTENVVGNPHWKVVPDSENLLDLEVGDLNQTTWFIRCARITGCDDYWGETPRVKVPVDQCKPNGINGGEISFEQVYFDPQGNNVIVNETSGFSLFPAYPEIEYIWLVNDQNLPNIVGQDNGWEIVYSNAGLPVVTDQLEVSGLTQDRYYIRCARIVGCEEYFGESNVVPIRVDICLPNGLEDGGGISLNENITNRLSIFNTNAASSTYPGHVVEYAWAQNETNDPNILGEGTSWEIIAGEKQLSLDLALPATTRYYVRLAKLESCDDYVKHSNVVAYNRDPCQQATFTGGSIDWTYDTSNDLFVVSGPPATSTNVELLAEYQWYQNDTERPSFDNTWELIEGANATNYELSGSELSGELYLIRQARFTGCQDVEVSSNIVVISPNCPDIGSPGTLTYEGEDEELYFVGTGRVDVPIDYAWQQYVFDGEDEQWEDIESKSNYDGFIHGIYVPGTGYEVHTIQYRWVAKASSCPGDYTYISDIVEILGWDDFGDEDNLRNMEVFPQPAPPNYDLTLRIVNAEDPSLKIQLYDIHSHLIDATEKDLAKGRINEVKVQTNQLKSGLYIMVVQKGNQLEKRKIVIK